MTVPRHIGGEHPDLTVRDLTRRARVLSRNSARGLALLQKAGFVDDKNSVSIGQRFLCILTHHIAQCIGIPSSSAQDRLLAPRTWIAGRFRSHPTRLARLVAQQSVEKLPRRGRDPLLRKQRTDALLDVSQRRSPQRQRILNRRTTNHQIPNHGHPWIQNLQSVATVMLALLWQNVFTPLFFKDLFSAVRTPLRRPPNDEIDDGVTYGGHGWLRRRSVDSFFSAPCVRGDVAAGRRRQSL